jgi:hypothetical protein
MMGVNLALETQRQSRASPTTNSKTLILRLALSHPSAVIPEGCGATAEQAYPGPIDPIIVGHGPVLVSAHITSAALFVPPGRAAQWVPDSLTVASLRPASGMTAKWWSQDPSLQAIHHAISS